MVAETGGSRDALAALVSLRGEVGFNLITQTRVFVSPWRRTAR